MARRNSEGSLWPVLVALLAGLLYYAMLLGGNAPPPEEREDAPRTEQQRPRGTRPTGSRTRRSKQYKIETIQCSDKEMQAFAARRPAGFYVLGPGQVRFRNITFTQQADRSWRGESISY